VKLVFTYAVLLSLACGTLVDSHGRSGIARIGPEGGFIQSDLGVTLYVPPHALAEQVTIMISASTAAPANAERAIEIRPVNISLALPGILTFRSVTNERNKIAHVNAQRWLALPGRLLEGGGLSSPLNSFGTFGLIVSTQTCAGHRDEDGDTLYGCADPICSGDIDCPMACQSHTECPCGSLCTGGGCSAPKPMFCATDSVCSAMPCRDVQSHGGACSFTMCAPLEANRLVAVDAGNFDAGIDAGAFDSGVDAGTAARMDSSVDAAVPDAGIDAGLFDAGETDAGFDAGIFDAGDPDAGSDAGVFDAGFDAGVPVIVQSCLNADEECLCETCADTSQCPNGTVCLPGTKHSGNELCGKNVCK
jgi:hypothetical protein